MSYLGSFTVGGSIPGASAVLDELGIALDSLRATLTAELPILLDATNVIQTQITAIGTAKTAIRIPAVVDIEAQLAGAQTLQADLSLSLTDPTAYLADLLDGLAQVEIDIGLLTPSVELDAQISAAAALEVEFQAKVDAVDLQLEALVTISEALGVQLTALSNIRAALQAAFDATSAAASAYVTIGDLLETAGAHCFAYTTTRGAVGAALDAETALTGLGSGDSVKAIVVLVDGADSHKVAAVDGVFRVS